MKLRSLLNMIAVLLFSFSIATTFNPFSAQAATIVQGTELQPASDPAVRSTVILPPSGSMEILATTQDIQDNAPGVLPFINQSGKTITFTISGQKVKVNGDTARWDYGPACQSGLSGDASRRCLVGSSPFQCNELAGGSLYYALKSSTGTTRCGLIGYEPINIIVGNNEALRIFNNDIPGYYSDNQGTAVMNYTWSFNN